MGQPSFSILLHEVTKLLSYAEAEDVTYFRLGSSGGVGKYLEVPGCKCIIAHSFSAEPTQAMACVVDSTAY